MSIWLFRAGSAGEFEEKFLKDECVYLTWNDLNVDLRDFSSPSELREFLIKHYDLDKPKTAVNWASQIYPIVSRMQIGDWIVLPSKRSLFTLEKLQENILMMYHWVALTSIIEK